MFDICYYSGLPYTCELCPEDEAPCYYHKTHMEIILNKGFTVRIDEDEIKLFNRLYCGLLSKFIQKAIHLAVLDKNNFDNIFFAENTENLVIKE